ncbi:hypothetical protein NERG_00502 [Nematocida ausubeli]|uniref:Myb-like domain-containing protein n=1 Tax=Nematocida ausubeli (strain ATCC PRA-371 / ERTm2) TaxID=1913371 RepID=H8ZA81_NEMA1|nr:hypothetical protein NERG_00502 [Nematocida ausubeli]
MESLMKMQYIDYILYMYISYIIDNNKDSKQTLQYTQNSSYFSYLIYNLKSKIESKEYEKDDEILTKYIIFLIHNKVLSQYESPLINRKFYAVFEYLQRTKGQNMQQIKRIILWMYNLLLKKSQNMMDHYEQMKDEEISSQIELMMQTAASEDVVISVEERKKYFIEFKERILKETQSIFEHLSLPLLTTVNMKEECVSEVVHEILEQKNLLLETGSALLEDEVENIKTHSILCSEKDGEKMKTPKKKEEDKQEEKSFTDKKKKYTSFINEYKHINLKSLINTQIPGVEVEWNESDLEDPIELEKSNHPDSIDEEKELSKASSSMKTNARRPKKLWTAKETEKLIKIIQICGTDWDRVQRKCDFKNTSRDQIIDKYKSLVKTKRMERMPRRK